MTFLPNLGSVQIDPPKVNYLLTTGKAAFFTSHGFHINAPGLLEDALKGHPARHPIEKIEITVHGIKFAIKCSMKSPDGRDPCTLTVWIVDPGTTFARLVTAYASP